MGFQDGQEEVDPLSDDEEGEYWEGFDETDLTQQTLEPATLKTLFETALQTFPSLAEFVKRYPETHHCDPGRRVSFFLNPKTNGIHMNAYIGQQIIDQSGFQFRSTIMTELSHDQTLQVICQLQISMRFELVYLIRNELIPNYCIFSGDDVEEMLEKFSDALHDLLHKMPKSYSEMT